MEKTWAVDTAQARAMTREGWTDFSMSMTVEQVIKAKNIQIRGDAATWHRYLSRWLRPKGVKRLVEPAVVG